MGVNTKSFDNASDMITFSRASGGYGFTKVGYGSELVSNGGFDSDSDWTLGTDWSISGGAAISNNTSGYNPIYQALGVSAGKRYLVLVEVSDYTSGQLTAYLGNSGNGSALIYLEGPSSSFGSVVGVGVYTAFITAPDGQLPQILLRSNGGFIGSITSVSVKEVIYNSSAADATLKLIYHPNDIPRIEYNLDGTAKGLLVEESRTNLITYSDAIDSSLTTLQNITPSDVEITSGVYQGTWRKFTEDTATSRHRLIGITAVTIPANSYATISCLVKNISGTRNVELMIYTGGDSFLGKFDLDAETSTVSKGGTGVSGTSAIENLGSGIYRISVSGIVSTTATVCSVILALADGVTVIYTGDGTSSIAATGMQVEVGAFSTSYIKTEGATATRSADVASIPVADFGFNAGAGTFVAEFDFTDPENDNSNYVMGGLANARIIYNNAGSSLWQTYDGNGSVTFYDLDNTGVSLFKAAVAVKTGSSVATALDGIIKGSSTYATSLMENLAGNNIAIGRGASSQMLNGHIKSIKYYPRRLTNAQLQELTT